MGDYASERTRARDKPGEASTAPLPKPSVEKYLRQFSAQLWHALRGYLDRVDLRVPSSKLTWTDERKFLHEVFDFLRPFELFVGRSQLTELLFPLAPYGAVAPFVPPTLVWTPGVAFALAPLFEQALHASIARLEPRWVELAENRPEPEAVSRPGMSLVAEGSIVPSHPIDLAVRRGLTTDGVIALADGPLAPARRTQLRSFRKVTSQWQGSRDPALWNFIKPDPADATAEEVAASIWQSAFWSGNGAVYAHRLSRVGDLYCVPAAMARLLGGAREHAPAPGEESSVAAAGSRNVDQLARAEAPRAKHADARQLRSKLADALTRLDYLASWLGPWKLDPTVAVGRAWVAGKLKADDKQVVAAAGAIEAQEGLLATIVECVQPLTRPKLAAGERDSIKSPLALYARAAASSHLATTCRDLIAAAANEQAQLVLGQLRGTAADLATATAGNPTDHVVEILASTRRLQSQLIAGERVDPDEVEATLLLSQEAALDARLKGLHQTVKALRANADELSNGLNAFHGRFRDIDLTAHFLDNLITEVSDGWTTDSQSHTTDITVEAQRARRAKRREALAVASHKFDRLIRDADLRDLIENGSKVIRDHATLTKWVKIIGTVALMVGVSLVASWAAEGVGALVAGGAVRLQMIEGAGILASGARVIGGQAARIGAAAGVVADAAVNTAITTAAQGGSLKAGFLENVLQTFGSNLILKRIGGDLELAKQVDRQLPGLWSRGNRAGAAMLDASVTVSAYLVINIATAFVAHQVTNRVLDIHEIESASSAAEDVFMQGAGLALGRLVHSRLAATADLEAKLAKLPTSRQLAGLRAKLLQLAAAAETAPRSEHAFELVHDLKAHQLALHAAIEHLDAADRDHAGISFAQLEAGKTSLERTAGELGDVNLAMLPLHQAHLDELIPGEHWTGTHDQIERALELAKKSSTVEQTRDPATGRWHVKIDGHPVILEERGSRPIPARESAPTNTRIEIRAELVPGSTFRGRGSQARVDPAASLQVLDTVLRGRKDVIAVELVGTQADAKPELVARAEKTVAVTVRRANNVRRLTVRIDIGPLEGETVARSWVNPTQEGFSIVAGKKERIEGRHVIQVSSALDAIHLERAVAHEVAEILEIDRMIFAGGYGGPDALRQGASGTVLSPHDRGRLAELDVVARRGDGVELQALIEHLGLREGMQGAEHRLALATEALSERAVAALRTARHEPLAGSAEHAQLESVRRQADADHAAELARAQAREKAGPQMPALNDANGVPLTAAALAERAQIAAQQRTARSIETWTKLLQLQAEHTGEGAPRLPYVVMIGGNASFAARDPRYLVIENRLRWHADGNREIAQTANQLKQIADAKLGDPTSHVGPSDRVPLDALRAFQDEIAAQGPVIDGLGTLESGPKGESLVHIEAYGQKLTFQIDEAIVATGFVPERIPGAPFEARLGDVVQQLDEVLRKAISDPLLSAPARQAAFMARTQLRATPIASHHEARAFSEILHDPDLRVALAADPVVRTAIGMGDAVQHWEDMVAADDPLHPHVFFGDQANIGRDQALRSNNWVIAGTGGTGVSAAEIVLRNNAKARVTMVGPDSPAGLMENDQFRMLAEDHAEPALAHDMQITKPTSGRLSILKDRVNRPLADNRKDWEMKHPNELVDESDIDPALRSKSVYGINGNDKAKDVTGTAYVASIGRVDDYPPVVLQLMEQARIRGGEYKITPLFHEEQYVGYRVRIVVAGKDSFIDVTGAASRFLPIKDARAHFDTEMASSLGRERDDFDRIERANAWDAPPESGNFAGGYGPTATQAARYAAFRATHSTTPEKK